MRFAFKTELRYAAALVALSAWGCSSNGAAGTTGPAGAAGAAGAPELGAGGNTATPASGGGGGTAATSPGGAVAAAGATPIGTGGTSPATGGATTGTGGTSSGGTSAAGGGTSGAMGGMSTMDAGAGEDAGSTGKPPCLSDSSQIVMIGDSYVNWITHTFPEDMNDVSMLNIGDFAVGGTSMGSGGIGLIPPQFDTALMTHPKIIAVIMDGGGNDILVPDVSMFPQGADCKAMGAMSPMIPDCQKIVQKALDAATQLFIHMAAEGVKDAVYFFYPHVPTGTWLAQDPNGMLDYALPMVEASCKGAYDLSIKMDPTKPIRCHFVNMVPVFDGHPEYFAMNDLHPNPTGSKAMAAAVWAKMKQDCVAQPASSGCCTPDGADGG